MGHSTGKPFEMGKRMQNVSCSFFFYSFSSFASQITILYYLNFIWLKYFTFISAELFCMTIRQAQFHGQRGNSRSRRGCNPQHMMGEQHPSPKSFPPCIKGWSLTRNESSENQNQLLREENNPQLWPVLTNLSTAACREQPDSWISPPLWCCAWYSSARCSGTTCTARIRDPLPFCI